MATNEDDGYAEDPDDAPRLSEGKLCRRQIKVGIFDGTSPFETFVAKFSNAEDYNNWSEADRLAHMKASLSGAAANVLWDTAEDKLNSLQKLVDVLATRFDSAETAERYRGELRTRKRRQGESLQSLHQDVQRLTSLAF